MFKLLPISKYILHKFKNKFVNRNVIFSGNIRDSIPIYLNTFISFINTHQYDYYIWLKKFLNNKVHYDLVENILINNFNTLLFFWSKNKSESIFLLENILSILDINSDIYVIGENNSGINQIKNIANFNNDIHFNKIISARKCSIYYGILRKKIIFNKNIYWINYFYKNYTINSLPGVFSSKKLDYGSKLLISTIKNNNNIKGKILEIGCGSGIISTIIGSSTNKKYSLFLVDINSNAITSSKKTIFINQIKNTYIFPSNIYSNIYEKFDLIVSNPPLHIGLNYSLDILYKIIYNAKNYLNYGGELRFVINNFLPYFKSLKKKFKINTLSKNKNYTVYSMKNI
ncbi:16S rRNA (guanine(1207)-N(2))-methyltransferase RsmC [Enterobacteriaceae endosymbiont of Plateumaris consimilis]|uniref:16S rRNA (guanine(1207)-N(2))-methyltransferase RsmC n=1 Tax=Enterobacteriaceae endosymbiont of Plateumaris consimilis TaxID=2675794 RepID=UPI00144A2160|nr:16S rRNA (guanine(1207)-N(2))-methyltransferase RsmC [Enterobacteriaceae endosymbiont of Plateumaris consimilis]QJC28574.1 16S rRNA (guanine(1207)-N(2))-methyltransferase RsmC [Enterobacteriaceae endosymbiont of Plateumaris consimilis]